MCHGRVHARTAGESSGGTDTKQLLRKLNSWRVVMAGCHGGFSWRVVMAGCHGGSSWWVGMVGCHGGLSCRVVMAIVPFPDLLIRLIS